MKKLFLTSAFLLGLSGIASAADAVVLEPTPEASLAPVFTWTGGYVGLQAGYLWGDGHSSYATGAFADPDIDGWLVGGYVGYNYQMANNIVLGIDADLAWSNADGFGDGMLAVGIPVGPGTGDLYELTWSGAARLRVGYAMDRFLPYLAGGLAFGDVDVTPFTAGVAGTTVGDNMVGWTIGAGVEYAFTDNLIGRAEYRYTDFGDFDIAPAASAELTTHDVRLGIAYKF